ncbi:alpha/beta fold hydrolase [Uliginosibacterium sp. H3]|uniref:Alpha/beta fold hydrolase n=1 Tax=Uliginosibacterium silvisoli TaxID=3114758 RepID=A0ABU6K1D7_9RHOO|nr:alpha/beta fold hydrolase [Uliginosibacterium sp. H3]
MTPSARRTPEQVAQAFLTPRRFTRNTAAFLPDAQVFVAEGPVGKVVGRMQGEGPCVVLLHGWEFAASDLAGFVPPLLAAGFSVLALDLPAHGASEGERVSIPLAAQALLDVQCALDAGGRHGTTHNFHAAIGHSLGAAVIVHAMASGLRVDRVVLLAAPAHAVDYARDYCARDGLDAHETELMLDLMHGRFGVDVRAISMPAQAASLTQPALFIHSDDDRVVPLAGSQQAARAWRGALHVTVEGLGHARLLRDAAVIEHVARFVGKPPGTQG